jgi:Txe/YoeB family toxin of Txe-Axe toxin-antitoxin module
LNYRKPSNNSDWGGYNINRLEECLKSQVRDNNIKYKHDIPLAIKKKLKKLKKESRLNKYFSDYSNRVDKLIDLTLEYPRADKIKNPDINSFTYKGFDIPEATHRRSKYDDKEKGYEVWSKDIDEESRLIYRIYDELKIIEFISIIGHDVEETDEDFL